MDNSIENIVGNKSIRSVTVRGEDFSKLIKLLKCFINNDKTVIPDRGKYIQLDIGKGYITGYSVRSIGIAKYMIEAPDIGDIWTVFMTIPKVLPGDKDDVTIRLIEDIDKPEDDTEDFDMAEVEYSNMLFKFNQTPMKKYEVDTAVVFDKLDAPYQKSKALDTEYRSKDNKSEIKLNNEDEHKAPLQAGVVAKVGVSPKHMLKIFSAINNVEKVKVQLEVECTPNKAVRISSRPMTIYLMPMRLNEEY